MYMENVASEDTEKTFRKAKN